MHDVIPTESARCVVMVAEDDPDLRITLTTVFEAAGCKVIPVANGEEAIHYLDVALRHPHSIAAPDAIVLDLHMPHKSGLDVLRFVRDSGWPVPGVVLTAFSSARVHAQAQQLGAVRTFDKPCDLDALRDEVMRLATN